MKRSWWKFWTERHMALDANTDPEVMMRQAIANAQKLNADHRKKVAELMQQEGLAQIELHRLVEERSKLMTQLD